MPSPGKAQAGSGPVSGVLSSRWVQSRWGLYGRMDKGQNGPQATAQLSGAREFGPTTLTCPPVRSPYPATPPKPGAPHGLSGHRIETKKQMHSA